MNRSKFDSLIANSVRKVQGLPAISLARRQNGGAFVFWIKPANPKAWGKIMASIRGNIIASPFQILSEDTGECSAVFTEKQHDGREIAKSEGTCGGVGPQPQLCNPNAGARVPDARYAVNTFGGERVAISLPGTVREAEKDPQGRQKTEPVRQLTLF